MSTSIMGVVIERNDDEQAPATEKVVLLPSPRYPSMPRFPPSPTPSNFDASLVRKATFQVWLCSPSFSSTRESSRHWMLRVIWWLSCRRLLRVSHTHHPSQKGFHLFSTKRTKRSLLLTIIWILLNCADLSWITHLDVENSQSYAESLWWSSCCPLP